VLFSLTCALDRSRLGRHERQAVPASDLPAWIAVSFV
jgi:hypothetical protein